MWVGVDEGCLSSCVHGGSVWVGEEECGEIRWGRESEGDLVG